MQILKSKGFDLKQLKRLRYRVEEIARANDFSPSDGNAMVSFFDDIEKDYDNLLMCGDQSENQATTFQ